MSAIAPSLECIPGKYNAGLLFSQLPMDGSGDFTVTRTTTPTAGQATRVNAAGLIETVADNVPRLDYPLGGITAGCPALLVEPSAVNLCLQSSDFTTWNQQNSLTVNPNTAISPDGTQNADTINVAAVTDSRITQVITVANSTTYTISCFYKNIALTAGETFNMVYNNFLGAPNNLLAIATIDLAAGTATYTMGGTAGTGYSGPATGRIENYGNGWYRVSMTFTVGSAGGAAGGFRPAIVNSATARSFYAWGAQLEVGSVATSYIPTTTAPITRSADVISKTGATALIGQTEGTVYLEVEQDPVNRDIFSLNTGTGNSIIFYKNSSNIVNARLYANSSTIFTIANAVATNGFVKIALAYKAGDSAMVINAGTAQTSASSFIFSSALSLVSLTPSWFTNAGFTKIRAVALYNTRLTDTQIALLTSPYTSYSSMASALSYTLG